MAKTPDDKKFLAATPNALKDSKNAKVIVGTVNKLAGASVALVDYFEWLGDYDAENYGGNRSRFEKAVVSLIGRKSYDDLDATSRLDSIIDFVFGPKKAKGGKLTVGGMTFKDLDKLIKKRPATSATKEVDKKTTSTSSKDTRMARKIVKFTADEKATMKSYKPSLSLGSVKNKEGNISGVRVSAKIDPLRGGTKSVATNKLRASAARKYLSQLGSRLALASKMDVNVKVSFKDNVMSCFIGGPMSVNGKKLLASVKSNFATAKSTTWKELMGGESVGKDKEPAKKPAAAEKKPAAAAKKPSARAIISALKEKGIKAKVVTNAKTGKKTIEIAVVETAE